MSTTTPTPNSSSSQQTKQRQQQQNKKEIEKNKNTNTPPQPKQQGIPSHSPSLLSSSENLKNKVEPQTFICWVHYGGFDSKIKDEIKFENVFRFNHLKPIIKKSFDIDQLSPYIQLYSGKTISEQELIDPETIITPLNIPNHIYIKVIKPSNYNNQSQITDNGNDEVRVFSSDNDSEPRLVFENGVDMVTIEKNFHIVSGWLKKKGDTHNKRVKSPFTSGDYTLIGSIPLYKTIPIVYLVFLVIGIQNKMLILNSDTSNDIKKKIVNTFKSSSKIQLYDISDNQLVDIQYDALSDDKKYELILPWFQIKESFF